MFKLGATYRVFVPKGGDFIRFEGPLLSMHNGIMQLDIGGVKTLFPFSSGAIAYIEEVDPDAEEARASARIDAWTNAIG